MDQKHGINITARDRVFQSWQHSMGLVRDYRAYSDEIEDNEPVSRLFNQFAEDEGRHASEFLDLLQEYDIR